MSSLHQLRNFASEAFKLVLEAKNDMENRPELIKRFDNLLSMAVDMLEIKEVQQQQHNAISHSFAEELITRPMSIPSYGLSPYFKEPVAMFVKESQESQDSQKSQTKDINVKDSEPTLIIHETVPNVSVVKLDSEACPYPYEHEPPQFASLLKHPFQISEIEADGTIDGTIDGPTEDDDVNSEEVGIDAETGMDSKDLEEMEIVEHEGKRYFRGLVSNDVHVIIGDEEAGECVGTFRNGKVILQ